MTAPQTLKNKSWFLKEYPKGLPQESLFELRENEVSTELSDGSDNVLVKVLYLSLDPYMRGRMKAGGSGYAQGFDLQKPLVGGGVGVVVSSANKSFKKGDLVQGFLGWELYTLVSKGQGLRPLDPKGLPISYFLGVLGMPGLTAYCGLLDIGAPKEGETVFVSAASGAVGQIVGQLAKIKGAHVVGSAGSAEKVELLKSTFGYDEAFNYKDESDLNAALKKYCPKGIDVYFENVGGAMLEAVLNNVNAHARIPVCGMISQYNLEEGEPIKNIVQLIPKRIKMQGFLVGDYSSTHAKPFADDVSKWLKEGKIKYVEDVSEGLESAPKAFIGLLQGHNVGKLVVHVADDKGAFEGKKEE